MDLKPFTAARVTTETKLQPQTACTTVARGELGGAKNDESQRRLSQCLPSTSTKVLNFVYMHRGLIYKVEELNSYLQRQSYSDKQSASAQQEMGDVSL